MNLRIGLVRTSLAAAFLLGALAAAAGTVPKGTVISVVTDQPVSSKDAKAGQPVSATVAKNVTIGGKVLIPKGATAKLSVSGVQASGRLSTPAKLYLHLVSVTVKGKAYTFATSSAGKTEKGKGKRDAGFIGGGAAGGTVVPRVVVGPEEIQCWVEQPRFLKSEEDGVGPQERTIASRGELVIGASVHFVAGGRMLRGTTNTANTAQ